MQEEKIKIGYEELYHEKDMCLDIEIAGRDREHLQQLNERIMAYSSRMRKLQEEKGQA